MAAGTLALASVAVAISLFSLLLNLGIIRRLRRNVNSLDEFPGFDSGPQPGTLLPDFVANTTLGAAVSSTAFASGDGYIAFLSASCEACKSQFPLLAQFGDGTRVDRSRSLIVVVGDPNGDSLYAREGTRFAQIVLEGQNGSLADAFAVRAFPTLIGVRDGRVTVAAPLVMALNGWDEKRQTSRAGSASS